MPECKQCQHFSTDPKVQCLLAPISQIEPQDFKERHIRDRACVTAIIDKWGRQVHGDVLEVGHGIWKKLRRMVRSRGGRRRGAEWYGVDPRWPDDDNGHYRGTASHLPFEDNRFDWAVATETIEHWSEHDETIDSGLCEIARVVKPDGKLVLTLPIGYHGDDLCYYGDLATLRGIFDKYWDIEVWEEWRRIPEPLSQIQVWRSSAKRRDRLMKLYGRNFSAWWVEVVATPKK